MIDTSMPLVISGLTMSPDLFRKGYRAGASPCACTATCCRGGVYADLRERDIIMAHRDRIRKYMDETQPSDDTQWFDGEEQDDADFASGRCIGTRVFNDKCVFLDREGHCSLQVMADREGMGRWAIKPLYCILFPIEITDRVVSFDDLLQDEQSCCSISGEFDVPVFRACRDELVHLVGEDGYRQMEEYYAALTAPAAKVRLER